MSIIETIATTYQELFTIRLSHGAFEKKMSYKDPVTDVVTDLTASSIFEVLSVEPDTDTRIFFANHFMDFKCVNNRIICYVRTASGKPYIQFPSSVRIRFLMQVQPAFLRNTVIEALGSEQAYQFTNVDRTGDAANRFLTTADTGVEAADKKNIGALELKKNCFAVIDIHTDVAEANYRVFDSENLTSPEYSIHFIKK